MLIIHILITVFIQLNATINKMLQMEAKLVTKKRRPQINAAPNQKNAVFT